MKASKILLFPCLLLFPYLALGASCDQIDKIAGDIQSSARSSGESSLSIAEVKQKLGQATNVKILGADQFYAWKTFMAFNAADGSGSGSGYYPGFNAKNGIRAAIDALGKPPMQITDNLTQYEWRCPGNSSLLLAAYDNQNIKKASGVNCAQGKCLPYSIYFKTMSKAETAYEQEDQLHGKEIRQNAFNLYAKPYNDFFHVTMTNREQLNADMNNRMNQFFVNLANCTKGIYGYAYRTMGNDIILVEPTIEGNKNGKCIVNIQAKQDKTLIDCQIPMNNLSVFSKASPSESNFSFIYSEEPQSEVDKVVSTSCKHKMINPNPTNNK